MSELLPRPRWHDEASCRGSGPRLWFPGRGDTPASAVAVCRGCRVRCDCLAAGMEPLPGGFGPVQGVFGGVGAHTRRALARIGVVAVSGEVIRWDEASGTVTIEPVEPVLAATG